MTISRYKIQSKKKDFDSQIGGRALRLRLDNYPQLLDYISQRMRRHGSEQRYGIALKLVFGYLNSKPSIIVVIVQRGGGGAFLY